MCVQSKEVPPPSPYSFSYPQEQLRAKDHFSSLLFSGEWSLTFLELASLVGVTAAACLLAPEKVNVPGSMTSKEVSAMMWTQSVVTRVYNSYLEAVFFSCPQYRTQPSREHALVAKKNLCGQRLEELETLVWHDRITLISQFMLNLGLYYAVPGYYPAAGPVAPLHERALRVLANHYVLSFGMYWMHRALHVVPWLWDNIHSYHHWARHPLSRNTYQDHWMDNFANAFVGHFFAQVLVPLDRGCFWFSHIFRIFESLEKHSGVSCYFNIAHSLQRWLPYAQMPHHHDWHHEGHKGCNYTFSALGGLWDCIFGTRKSGRAAELPAEHTTRYDKAHGMKAGRSKTILDHPLVVVTPVVGVASLVVLKLGSTQPWKRY
mmetsp:Transcript_5503/g.7769  ORF Transcript_5503/g.7769 Transcript_5503/m.7769 type:complete len:375 (-) Transcript_5503:524-1648(-)|eukprot:CAMPEP_0194747708 /NCGR_PEP_ID=MMETSP0323_2-20130528/1867_1 /TAXON_ID=2866 ORGANISM="Crypthecodinium cohnii, Strain Seligo" /NCGR_SAMPLE_ID=MMETSP0323_2 /ASSEMBLY_ACC=CAM_ASM_000346 /LENGTH=374 /DNA_ID=CAMNT_0039661367 /DNA_START=19 /DNA_END=1143 /DNA_ORIENTATION=-